VIVLHWFSRAHQLGNIENAEKTLRKLKKYFCREQQGDLKQGQREEEEKKKGKLLLMKRERLLTRCS